MTREPWSRRCVRWLAALGALLAYLVLLLFYCKAQYQQVRRLNRLLDLEKHTNELLQNLEVMDHHLHIRLERLAALHRQ